MQNSMIEDLYKDLKRLEGALYLDLSRDRKQSIRRLCGKIFATAEDLLGRYQFSPAQRETLEGISKSSNTIDDTIMEDFDRIKANEWLVKPYISELEKRAIELGIGLPK